MNRLKTQIVFSRLRQIETCVRSNSRKNCYCLSFLQSDAVQSRQLMNIQHDHLLCVSSKHLTMFNVDREFIKQFLSLFILFSLSIHSSESFILIVRENDEIDLDYTLCSVFQLNAHEKLFFFVVYLIVFLSLLCHVPPLGMTTAVNWRKTLNEKEKEISSFLLSKFNALARTCSFHHSTS